MRNIKLTIAYEGTNYVGWQVQPNGPSVQTEVEKAINRLTHEEIRVTVAGRTDSGVHALGQVANFHTDSKIVCDKIQRALQTYLPSDIAVRKVEDVPGDFHATYSAKRKHYRYLILNSPIANPMLHRFSLRNTTRLDIDLMQEAANHLLGTHDFRCFETNYPNKSTSVRTMLSASVTRQDNWSMWTPANPFMGDLELVCFDIVGNGFLYNMVRSIVGTLLKVGMKRWHPDRMREIIETQDRKFAGETAPPQGLYLMEVMYDLPQNKGDDPAHFNQATEA